MGKYVFEKINCSVTLGGVKTAFEEHREKIDEYASKGFRFAGWIPTSMDGYGHIMEIDLIFESTNV